MNVLVKIKLIAFVSVISASVTSLASTWNFLKFHFAQENISHKNLTIILSNGSMDGMLTQDLNLLRSMIRSSIIVGVISSTQIIVSSCVIAASKTDVVNRWRFWTAFTITTQIICMVCLLATATSFKKFITSEKEHYLDIIPLLNMYYTGLGFYLSAHILLVISSMLVMRMMSTAMSMIAFWTFLRTQNDLQNDWVLSSDFSPGHSSVRVIKIDSELTISRTITRVVAVATGSIAFLQIIFGGYLLTAKGKDIITKSKSWMIFTLGSVGFSWVILTGILILQINGQETITHF
ncbi:unnamed protein product, partial [Allacma fusca]